MSLRPITSNCGQGFIAGQKAAPQIGKVEFIQVNGIGYLITPNCGEGFIAGQNAAPHTVGVIQVNGIGSLITPN
jgi:hypothetical protein